VDLDSLTATRFSEYACHCAWATARAHAKTGDPAAISGYLGNSDVFDRALLRFAEAYAVQTWKDHAALARAVKSGRLRAQVAASPRGK
jgi:hypothetical protein